MTVEPNWDAIGAVPIPAWYEDGKFGIFIHWGVYAVPGFGNEWYPRNMYQPDTPEHAHHLATYGDHATFGYKDFIPQFTAAQYDPAAWAQLFAEAGARFIVPVAEHHDGFPLYDCSFTEWSAVKRGPQRDLIGDLAAAVRAADMVFGVSYHRAENWFFYDGGRTFPSDVQDDVNRGLYGPAQPKSKDNEDYHAAGGPDAAFLEEWLARACELIDRYRPQLFWFDWWIQHDNFIPYLPRFAAHYYGRAAEWGQGVAINYKYEAFPERVAVLDIERGQLSDIRQRFWQNDTSVAKNSWGYTAAQEYKQVDSIVQDLVDVVSKNGALLLNIGPRPDGSIPDEEQAMLRQIGAWLRVNGQAIYSTRPWKVYGEGPTEVTSGAFTDTKRQAFTSRDFRFTANGDRLYVTLLGWPEDGVATVRSLGTDLRLYPGQIGGVSLLGHGAVPFTRDAEGLHVTLPAQRPCDFAWVLEVAP